MTKKLTPKTFQAIKTLLAGGATYEECANYMDVSVSTVGRVARAENFQEYGNSIAAIAIRCNQKKVKADTTEQEATPELDLKMPGGTLSGAYQINRIVELLKAQSETLVLISNKLAFIVDELTR